MTEKIGAGSNDQSLKSCTSVLRRFFPLILFLIFGFSSSIALYFAVHSLDMSLLKRQFNSSANDSIHAIQLSIDKNTEIVYGLKAFYDASQKVERDEFRRYCEPLIARHPEIQSLVWIPKIADSDSMAFVASVRRSGLSTFDIRHILGTGEKIVEPPHAVHFPTEFAEPQKHNARRLGIDHASFGMRIKAITEAERTGEVASSGLTGLVRNEVDSDGLFERGFILFAPVYRKNGVTSSAVPSPDSHPLDGVVAGFYLLNDLIERSLAPHSFHRGMNIIVSDATSGTGTPLHLHQCCATEANEEIAEELVYSDSINVCGWRWDVRCVPSSCFDDLYHLGRAKYVLVFGITFTVLVVMYLFGRISRDIEKSRLADQLAASNKILHDANRKLKELDEMRNNFLSSAAHELRTPLVIMQGIFENLSRAGPSDSHNQARKFIAMGKNNVARMARLVQQFLESTRIEAGVLALDREDCDISTILRDAVECMRVGAEHQRVELDADDVEVGIHAELDDERMNQVFINLIDNAIRFAKSRVYISLKLDLGAVEISIEDDGAGISESEFPLLFQKFSRLESARGRAHLGLGLSIVKTIVEQHCGSITAINRRVPERGLCFVIRLPLRSERA